jgi:hypothetical protein
VALSAEVHEAALRYCTGLGLEVLTQGAPWNSVRYGAGVLAPYLAKKK